MEQSKAPRFVVDSVGLLDLSQVRATSVPPATAHLQSLCSWRSESSSQVTEIVTEVSVCPFVAVASSDPGQPGKKTAGIDGVKSVSPAGRFALTEAIHPKRLAKRKPKPLRRVWIPKPGKTEQRPLGIPVPRSVVGLALLWLCHRSVEYRARSSAPRMKPSPSASSQATSILSMIRWPRIARTFLPELKELFVQVLLLAQETGVLKLGLTA